MGQLFVKIKGMLSLLTVFFINLSSGRLHALKYINDKIFLHHFVIPALYSCILAVGIENGL
jgi:hypothetical protein